WPKMPNPLTHRHSFSFSDSLKLAMIMPFILKRFLNIKHIKNTEINILKERLNESHTLIPIKLIECWTTVSKALKITFSKSFTQEEYKILQNILNDEINILILIFPNIFKNLPNVHIKMHLFQHARNFGTLVNTAVGIKELVHKTFKNMVQYTNKKQIERDLVYRYNTLQALRFIIDGGKDYRFPNHNCKLATMKFDTCISQLCSEWYAVNEISELQESDLDNTYTISQESNFTDIILYGKWSIQQVKKANFETKLTITNPLLRVLMNTYSNDLKMPAAIINMRIECYNYITYKILDNVSNYTQIKIHVGDIVEINEVEECQAYAIVKAIFRYKANNGNFYSFLILQWFKYSGYNERYLKCPLYYLQKPDEKKWFKVFPVSYVNKIPKNHFIHACTNSVLEIVMIVTIENI
ncbi:hypothetical protein C2G38_2130544, partial [Gigaspora rosea]